MHSAQRSVPLHSLSRSAQSPLPLTSSEQEQRLLHSIQQLHQSLDLVTILKTAVTEVQQVLQADRILVYRFQPQWAGIVVEEVVVEESLSLLHLEIRDPCFAKHYARQYQAGRIKAIADIQTAEIQPCHAELLTQFQIRANLIVPILQKDDLWGLLLAQQCYNPRLWQDWEVHFLQQITFHVGIAVQQADTHNQTVQRNIQLEYQIQEHTEQFRQALDFESLLKRLTDNVRDSLDEDQILQTSVQEIVSGVHVGACHASLYDLEKHTATIQYEATIAMIPLRGKVYDMNQSSAIYEQLLAGQSFQFSDYHPVRGRVLVLACPILDEQGVLGDLWLFDRRGRVFDDLELRLVKQVANQCAIALRQARLYQAAQQQVQELARLNALKDDFLSTISHELRTPMASIKMAAQMIENCLDHDSVSQTAETVRQYVQVLKNECQQEISLINNLLELSHLEAGTEPILPITMDVTSWIRYITEPFETQTRQQQQHLRLEISQEPLLLTTDFTYLEYIMMELLQNACKYTPAQETIVVSVGLEDHNLLLQVANSGVEIPDSEHVHIFNKFYRIPNNDPWKHSGTGLGLALARKRAEQLTGLLAVHSGDGWTTFTLKLPLSLRNAN